MEVTWLKTCAAKKYTFFRAHFWSRGTAYLKCICTQLYFWCFDDVYFWIFFGVFAMRFWSKNVYILYPFSTCVAPRRFFYALGTCVLRRCIYFPRVWKSDLYFYCICICLLVHVELDVSFLESASLDCTCGKKKITFLLQVYFGGIFFPKVKRTYDCFKTARVSIRFGDFNHMIICPSNPK
jgi:hypothetical protein